MLMKQQTSRFKHIEWIKINKSRKILLYKEKHDLLYRKDTEFFHLQKTIDWKKPWKKNVLKFLRFKA